MKKILRIARFCPHFEYITKLGGQLFLYDSYDIPIDLTFAPGSPQTLNPQTIYRDI